MTGTIKRSTTNYALGIPFFDAPNWGAVLERNFNIIDAMLGLVSDVGNIVGDWANNTAYAVNDRVVDTTDNTLWQCAVAHTSAATGTFASDRSDNPTYWSALTNRVVAREEFTTGTDYLIGDFVYDTDEYLCGLVNTAFTGGSSLRDNIDDLDVIFDLKVTVGDVSDDADAASASATAAATSETNAASSATTATTKATAAATSATAAATSETNAAASETAAASSASDAATSATAAATSATNAASSATSAASDASDASDSATAAAASAAEAAASAETLSPVEDQIGGATSAAFADNDALAARKSSDGSLIKQTWSAIKSTLQTLFDARYATTAQGTKADNALPKAGGTMTGELVFEFGTTGDGNALRIKNEGSGSDGYGAFWRIDSNNLYLMLTALDDANGNWRTPLAPPLAVILASGDVKFYNNISTNGTITEAGQRVYSANTKAAASDFWANTDNKPLTTDGVWGAAEEVSLTDAASIALDLNTGINFKVTLGGNRTLANPTNAKPGQSGVIELTQDATGSRTLAYGANWVFAGGTAPTLTTTAGTTDLLFYHVISSTKVFATLVKDIS